LGKAGNLGCSGWSEADEPAGGSSAELAEAVEPVDSSVEAVDSSVEAVDGSVEAVDSSVEAVDGSVEAVEDAESAEVAVQPDKPAEFCFRSCTF